VKNGKCRKVNNVNGKNSSEECDFNQQKFIFLNILFGNWVHCEHLNWHPDLNAEIFAASLSDICISVISSKGVQEKVRTVSLFTSLC